MHLARPSRGILAAIAAAVVVAGAGGAVAVTQLGSSHPADNAAAAGAGGGSVVPPAVHVSGLRHGRISWRHHLTIAAQGGVLSAVSVQDHNGDILTGRLSSDRTRWVGQSRLVPLNHYRARVVLNTAAGHSLVRNVRFHASDSKRHLTALLSPGDGDAVGVGSPVIVHFSRTVPAHKRAVVEKRLAVSTVPPVTGAWHWMNDQEVHWRPPTYWKAHTAVTVSSNLDGLYLGHGLWAQGDHQTTFHIGDSHISRVDVARHEMYVYNNGHLINTFPISAGRTQYPTKNGVHITFEKSQVVTMDSATVGIPRNSPDGYYEQVYWDVRISYGGAFVHAAPWSVAEQGISNVSHGCVNLSTTNATWFYNWSLRGDIVDVYNSTAPVDTADPGMSDWNMSWKKWVAGDAAPTGDALHTHAPLPHDAEPAAPGTATTTAKHSSGHSSTSSSPSPSPSPSPYRHHHHHNNTGT